MNEKLSRRMFSAAGLAAGTFPLILPRAAKGANDRIRVGVIGVGNRSNLLIDQLPEGAEIVAAADCYRKRPEDAAAKRKAAWRIYDDYRTLLEQKDIDGVIVGTNDHARVRCAIHAVQAGKDVYAEKPLSLYVAEGRALVRAVRKYNRILQVGSQQRSMAMNRLACDFVRNGGLGRIRLVLGVDYSAPVQVGGLPEEPVPEGMNWDMWLGQTAQRPYNPELFTHWMRYWDYSGADMTNWGAHGIDQVQAALGMDETGPVEFRPLDRCARGLGGVPLCHRYGGAAGDAGGRSAGRRDVHRGEGAHRNYTQRFPHRSAEPDQGTACQRGSGQMEAGAMAGEVSHAGLAGLHAQPQDAAGRCGNGSSLHQCVPPRQYHTAVEPHAALGSGGGALHRGRRSERPIDAPAPQGVRTARNRMTLISGD